MKYDINGMRNCLGLAILFLLVCAGEGSDQNAEDGPAKASKPWCRNPSGNIGDIIRQRCRVKTCTRKGRKGYWEESYASDRCCNYNQKWFEIGEKITQILSTDNCTTVYMRCAKNNVAKSEIEIDTEYNCVTSNDLKTLIELHANKTEDNIEMLSDKIGENSQKLLDIENLLKVHLTNTGLCCNNPEEGVKWIVIQRHGQFGNPKDYFSSKLWVDYVNGFGDSSGEFWLGLDKMAQMTAIGKWELRVDLEDFAGKQYFAQYSNFRVNVISPYRLTVSGYDAANSSVEDALFIHNGAAFSTSDNDNDIYEPYNCAQQFKGAWWYTNCHDSNLNGFNYIMSNTGTYADGIIWTNKKNVPEQGDSFSWPKVEMKIRESK